MKISLLAAALLVTALDVSAQTKYGRSTGYRVAPNSKLGGNAQAAAPAKSAPAVRRNEAPAPEIPAGPAPQAGAKIMPVQNRWDPPSQGERVHFGNAPVPEGYGYAINSGGKYIGGSFNRNGNFQSMTMGNGEGKATHQSWINELNNVQNNNTRINGNAHNSNNGGKK